MEKFKGIIRTATDPKEFMGKMQIGFTLSEDPDKWYNIAGIEEALISLRETSIKKGNEIEFEMEDGKILNLKVLNFNKEKETEKSSDKIVNIKGKDFVTYAGLLEKAHEKGLQNMEILKSWVSEDMTKAWCIVRARFLKGEEKFYFDGFGSSTPENTGEMTKSHPVEMAHTRAKGRALRDFLNIGTAMIEELKNN